MGIDGLGVVAGARALLRSKGWQIQVFEGSASPTEPGYANLRAEQYWMLSKDMEKDIIGLYVELDGLTDLKEELRPHLFVNDGKVIKVTPKRPGPGTRVGESVMEQIGRTPDKSGAVCIARWVHSGGGDARNKQQPCRILVAKRWCSVPK